MPNYNQKVTQILREAVAQKEQEIGKIAKESTWQTLKSLEKPCAEKLKSIILNNFYNVRAESQYYDRTYMFLESGRCRATHGGGHYVMQVWLDTDLLFYVEPAYKGQFASYGYTWGERRGDPLSPEEKNDLIEYWNDQYSIIDTFQEWFDNYFAEMFEADFHARLHINGFESI